MQAFCADHTQDETMLPVFDRDQRMVGIQALWQQHHALIFFIRSTDCATCRQHLLKSQPYLEQLAKQDARLIIVTDRTPQLAAAYIDELQLQLPIYSDQTQRSYELFGLARPNLVDQLNPGLKWLPQHSIISPPHFSTNLAGGLVLMLQQRCEPAWTYMAEPGQAYPHWNTMLQIIDECETSY